MRTELLEPTPENISTAAALIRSGECVAMPTETVYGLAANALDAAALARVFAAKERPTFDPLIVHLPVEILNSPEGPLARLAELGVTARDAMSREQGALAERLMRAFWPGPLTIVLPKGPAVPDLATSGLATVALRMPRHPVAQKLLAAAGVPLAAPSANRFGRISPTRAAHVLEELGGRIPAVLDGGPCEIGVESTVVAAGSDGSLALLRPGAVTAEELERVAGSRLQRAASPLLAHSPGTLESHYAPAKTLRLMSHSLKRLAAPELEAELASVPRDATLGLLVQKGPAEEARTAFAAATSHPVVARSLSDSGDLGEAARNLFALLRELDASPAFVLFAEPCEEPLGLGHAISDRLSRAAKKR
jgi:L-threonylcarbamoyladenylate synthase